MPSSYVDPPTSTFYPGGIFQQEANAVLLAAEQELQRTGGARRFRRLAPADQTPIIVFRTSVRRDLGVGELVLAHAWADLLFRPPWPFARRVRDLALELLRDAAATSSSTNGMPRASRPDRAPLCGGAGAFAPEAHALLDLAQRLPRSIGPPGRPGCQATTYHDLGAADRATVGAFWAAARDYRTCRLLLELACAERWRGSGARGAELARQVQGRAWALLASTPLSAEPPGAAKEEPAAAEQRTKKGAAPSGRRETGSAPDRPSRRSLTRDQPPPLRASNRARGHGPGPSSSAPSASMPPPPLRAGNRARGRS